MRNQNIAQQANHNKLNNWDRVESLIHIIINTNMLRNSSDIKDSACDKIEDYCKAGIIKINVIQFKYNFFENQEYRDTNDQPDNIQNNV